MIIIDMVQILNRFDLIFCTVCEYPKPGRDKFILATVKIILMRSTCNMLKCQIDMHLSQSILIHNHRYSHVVALWDRNLKNDNNAISKYFFNYFQPHCKNIAGIYWKIHQT